MRIGQTIFDKLSERQQQALKGSVADGGTRKALARRGLVEPDDESGFTWVRLTDKGRLVLLEHAQRDNTADKFKPGDEVVGIYSYFHGNMPVINAERQTVVQTDEHGLVEVKSSRWSSPEWRTPFRLARLADAEAAGVMGLVQS